jgi:SpoVK/Ycf46/Vps4 family AAA+-type ATPase
MDAMATADQIKSLIRAYNEQDKERFKTTSLQIAAYEAKLGHSSIAREIKALVDKGTSMQRSKVLDLNSQNQVLQISMPNDKLTDLIVSDEIIERIERILKEFINRSKLLKFGMGNRRKILIEGEPGTGKTLTASIIASELNLPLYTVQMDKLVTKFMGETSVKLRQIFDSIESTTGVYLFDEFDAIGADRSYDNDVGEMRRVLNSFLQFLEQDTSDSIIIAATNNQKMLDKALFRRFDDVLHYQHPSEEDIERVYQHKLGAFSPHFCPTNELIRRSISLSQAEITRVCDDAIKHAILNDEGINEASLNRLIDERLSIYAKEAR